MQGDTRRTKQDYDPVEDSLFGRSHMLQPPQRVWSFWMKKKW